eukprot:338100-Amphidinium_carterae.2
MQKTLANTMKKQQQHLRTKLVQQVLTVEQHGGNWKSFTMKVTFLLMGHILFVLHNPLQRCWMHIKLLIYQSYANI